MGLLLVNQAEAVERICIESIHSTMVERVDGEGSLLMPLRIRKPGEQGLRRRIAYRPNADTLELRIAPAIDLATIASNPYGVQLGNSFGSATNGAGYTVSLVGDIAQTGFQDVVIGAPSFVRTSPPTIGSGSGSQAYLVFGSNGAGVGNVNWLNLTSQQRTGDVSTLGNSTQNNPLNGNATFPYNGLRLTTSSSSSAQLGASAAAVPNITNTGINGFLIGAPGALDANGDGSSTGAGRAYLVYGGSSIMNLTIAGGGTGIMNLDNTATLTGSNIVTFWTNMLNAGVGTSVASVGNLLGDGGPDIAISAPNASMGGLTNNGAIFVIPGSYLRTVQTTQILLDTVGQTGGVPGVVFIGAASGDKLGSSLATAGDVNGATSSSGKLFDLLIGASNADVGAGAAYLVYGATNLAAQATADTNGFLDISVSRLGVPNTTTGIIAGATFDGTSSGDQTGFAVNNAGDFNNDGFGDFMIGSPGYLSGTGLVTLVYGQGNNSSGVPGIVGTYVVNSIPASVSTLSMTGASTASYAGFSLSPVQSVNGTTYPDIIIGSPGVNGNIGAAYLIAGRSSFVGSYNLGQTESNALQGIIFTASNSTVPGYIGTSVSGLINSSSTSNTLDSDNVGDFVIGAPGFGFSGLTAGGEAFMLEGAKVPLSVPSNTGIPVTIGVGAPFGPFTINATTPAALQIYVFSNATVTPVFAPVTDINPASIVVNGVSYPNATIAQDPVDENGDGIPDAIVTITPRSNLGLTAGTRTITISGTTFASGSTPVESFSGSATVQVTGSSGGVVVSGVPGQIPTNEGFGALPQNGSSLVPSISSLSQLAWRPLPIKVAYQQFQLPTGFGARIYDYFHPNKVHQQLGSGHRSSARGIFTLGNRVFTRDPIHAGKHTTYTHSQLVVPAYLQTEST